jgi:hypothetical protein
MPNQRTAAPADLKPDSITASRRARRRRFNVAWAGTQDG